MGKYEDSLSITLIIGSVMMNNLITSCLCCLDQGLTAYLSEDQWIGHFWPADPVIGNGLSESSEMGIKASVKADHQLGVGFFHHP